MEKEYFVVFDLRNKAKKVDKGWKRLYTYSTENETCIVEFKPIPTEEELEYYKKLSKFWKHIFVLEKDKLIKKVALLKKGYEKVGFKFTTYNENIWRR